MQIDEIRVEIEQTARELERFTFSPILLFPVDNFIRMTKNELLQKMDTIASYSRNDLIDIGFSPADPAGAVEKKIQTQLKMMAYQFKLVSRLRKNEPEAWDAINELYEED